MKLVSLHEFKEKNREQVAIMIPCIFTFLNAFSGFLAIIKAIEGEYVAASYCIIFAIIMDLFDGRVARALGSTSCFGMELDSLCDAISFGLAPAILMYQWRFDSLGHVGLAVLGCYMCAGLFRLARFNLPTYSAQPFFVGLPIPIAALCVTAIVLYADFFAKTTPGACVLSAPGLFLLMIVLSFLMASMIPFPSGKRSGSGLMITSLGVLSMCAVLGSKLLAVPFRSVAVMLFLASYLIIGPPYQWYQLRTRE